MLSIINNVANFRFLGVNLNNTLGFGTHVTNICNRVSKKLHALARFSEFMSNYKRRMTITVFIASELDYCPLYDIK